MRIKASHEYGDLINSCINSGTREYDFRFALVGIPTHESIFKLRSSTHEYDFFFASVLMILITFCEYKNIKFKEFLYVKSV